MHYQNDLLFIEVSRLHVHVRYLSVNKCIHILVLFQELCIPQRIILLCQSTSFSEILELPMQKAVKCKAKFVNLIIKISENLLSCSSACHNISFPGNILLLISKYIDSLTSVATCSLT